MRVSARGGPTPVIARLRRPSLNSCVAMVATLTCFSSSNASAASGSSPGISIRLPPPDQFQVASSKRLRSFFLELGTLNLELVSARLAAGGDVPDRLQQPVAHHVVAVV